MLRYHLVIDTSTEHATLTAGAISQISVTCSQQVFLSRLRVHKEYSITRHRLHWDCLLLKMMVVQIYLNMSCRETKALLTRYLQEYSHIQLTEEAMLHYYNTLLLQQTNNSKLDWFIASSLEQETSLAGVISQNYSELALETKSYLQVSLPVTFTKQLPLLWH